MRPILFVFVFLCCPAFCGAMPSEGEEDCGSVAPARPHKRLQAGLWKNSHVPKEGWVCDMTIDLGAGEAHPCEMCRARSFQYLHRLTHPNPDTRPTFLIVGACCAPYLERPAPDKEGQGLLSVSHKARLKYMKYVERARDAFIFSPEWRPLSIKEVPGGGWYMEIRGSVLMPKGKASIIFHPHPSMALCGAFLNGEPLGLFESVYDAKLFLADKLFPRFLVYRAPSLGAA